MNLFLGGLAPGSLLFLEQVYDASARAVLSCLRAVWTASCLNVVWALFWGWIVEYRVGPCAGSFRCPGAHSYRGLGKELKALAYA